LKWGPEVGKIVVDQTGGLRGGVIYYEKIAYVRLLRWRPRGAIRGGTKEETKKDRSGVN